MEKFIPLLARVLLSTIFIKAGISHILDPASTQQYMAAKGLPLTGILLFFTIVVLLIGGFSVLFGYKARIGALLLIGFLIPTTLIFHTQFPEEESSFFKNLGLIGGLFMIVAYGSGAYSLENQNYLNSSSAQRRTLINR